MVLKCQVSTLYRSRFLFSAVGLVLLISSSSGLVSAACPSPDIPVDVYALTDTASSFATGALFDIVCVPGRRPDTVVQLRCDANGEWLGHWPDCSIRENKAKWWMLFIGMVSVVVLVPCIVPRLYFTFIDTSEPRKAMLSGRRHRTSRPHRPSDKIRGYEMQNFAYDATPVPPAAVYYEPNKYPTRLPPIRTPIRQRDNMASIEDHAAI